MTSLTSWRAACDISTRSFGLPTIYERPIVVNKNKNPFFRKFGPRASRVKVQHFLSDESSAKFVFAASSLFNLRVPVAAILFC